MDLVLITIYVITASVFSFSHTCDGLGWRNAILFLILSVGVTALLEGIAVATGLLFGSYSYGNFLGLNIFGIVPVLVPLTWFMMLYPSLVIALRIVPHNRGSRTRYFLLASGTGAIVMVAWDLVLDPLMVAHGYWTWSKSGPYFGIPVSNFIGWWVTSFVILLVFLALARIPESSLGRLRGRFGVLPVITYGATGLISVVTAWDLGLVGPSIVATFAMLPWMLSGYWGREYDVGQ